MLESMLAFRPISFFAAMRQRETTSALRIEA